MVGFHFLLRTRLAITHRHPARAMLDSGNRALEKHAIPEPGCEGIRHALISALNAEKFRSDERRSTKLLDGGAPDRLQCGTGAAGEANGGWRGAVFAEQIRHRNAVQAGQTRDEG